jgi:hypothetical protein
MKRIQLILCTASAILLISSLSSCFKDPVPVTISSFTIKDLNADYAPLVFSSDPSIPPTRPAQTRKYTLFNLETGKIIANTDSATTQWDIGFRSTSIIFNGGTSGPGSVGAIVQKGIFEEIKSAPTTGYVLDNKNTNTFAVSSSPVTSASAATNQWWFNSGSNTSTIVTPIAGQIIIIKTTSGRYAKMEILSFYKGAPTTVNNLTDLDRHYTFRYVYQTADGNSF